LTVVDDDRHFTAGVDPFETDGPKAATPDRIAALCVELASVTGAGMSVMTAGGHSGTVYASDEVAARIEELQFTLGEGPCIDAFSGGEAVFVADLLDPVEGVAGRWPGFMEAAAKAGVRAVFGFPLRIGVIKVGVMDLYRDKPGPLTPGQLSAALLGADAAARSMLDLDASTSTAFADVESDRSAHRFEVHQATGMVKVQLGSSMADALITLRAYAFAQERSINEVAMDVIARRLRFPMEE
jgi:GAF domain-containing protein